MLIVRAACLTLILTGLLLLIVRYLSPRLMLAPFYLHCTVGCLILAAGVLNVMLPVLLALAALGIAGLVSQRRMIPNLLRTYWPMILGLAVIGIYFAFFFAGTYFEEYDDISHWAYTVRVMMESHSQPSFQHPIPGHFSYPTGMAGLLYAYCSALGAHSDGLMMYLQFWIMLSALMPMLEFCPSSASAGKRMLYAFVALGCCTVMISELSLLWLRVDAVVSMFTVGCIAFIALEADRLRKHWTLLIPPICFLPLIKTSGILMAVLAAVMFALILGQQNKSKAIRHAAALLGIALAGLLLWNSHVSLVFENGMQSRHSISLRHMGAVLLSKGLEGNLKTLLAFLRSAFAFTFTRPSTLLCWLLLAGTSAVSWRDRTGTLCFLVIELSLYLVYMGGLLGMYLFTMPDGQIASFTRYAQTIVIVMHGLMGIRWMELLRNAWKDEKRRTYGILLMAAVSLFFSLTPFGGGGGRNWKSPKSRKDTLCSARCSCITRMRLTA